MIDISTSYDFLNTEARKAWETHRSKHSKKDLMFFEALGRHGIKGQMWFYERKMLYDAVCRRRPNLVYEVGTMYGGGSTYFITEALRRNGTGVLHTCEIDEPVYKAAKQKYSGFPGLKKHVKFHYGDALTVYPPLLRHRPPDLVFLDGAEIPEQTLNQFRMFDKYKKADIPAGISALSMCGTHIMTHRVKPS